MVALTPLPQPIGSSPQTVVEAEVTLDLSRLLFLGPMRHLHPPAWIIKTMTSVMMPVVWKSILKVMATLRSADGNSAIRARIHDDETGIYRRIRRSTGQQDVTTRDAGAASGPAATDASIGRRSWRRAFLA